MNLHPFAKRLREHEIEGDEKSNEEYRNHGGSFGVYFRNKQVKLDTQAKENNVQASRIFSNCVIYITGYTVPSAVELKRLIVENGGQVCAFLGGKSYATHIVAASLTSRKAELYANTKVVKPAWVTESVKLGRLLDWTRYRTLKVVGNRSIGEHSYHVETLEDEAEDLGLANGKLGEGEVSHPATDSDSKDVQNMEEMVDVPGPQGDRARIAWIQENRQRVNCLAPNFISDYFSKSRLHFLTTRKIDLRRRCHQYNGAARAQGNSMRRILMHVDFDSFFVSASLGKYPHLRDKPVCVSHGSDGSDVASCNYVARRGGVVNGMWVARAKIQCPDLICLPYDFDEYTRCSNHLYDTLLSLSPGYICAISVDEAMVDISNLIKEDESKSIAEICDNVRSTIRSLTNIDVSIGVGTNILLAKLALKLAKPAGSHVMRDLSDACNMKIRDLPGVGHQIDNQLKDVLKVSSLNDLHRIPLSELQSKLGNVLGQKLYGYARGMDTSDITSLDIPIKSVGLDIGWGVRVLNKHEQLEFATNCTTEIWSRITKSRVMMDNITVKVYKKSEGASFIAPKYMGHGLCEIVSRSRRIMSRTTLPELQQVVISIVESLNCHPLDFRGVGLHVKVTEHSDLTAHPNQVLITDMQNTNIRTPPSSSSKKPMIALSPRKRSGGMTLTQMVEPRKTRPGSDIFVDFDLADVDMDVLAELPSQIRKEILLKEDDYITPARIDTMDQIPMFKRSAFMDVRNPAQLRAVIKQWVQNAEAPTAEDAEAFSQYITRAMKDDSSWIILLDLSSWLQTMVTTYAKHPDWNEFCKIIDSQVQTLARSRLP